MYTLETVRTIGNPERARILMYLKDHSGGTVDSLSEHLGFPKSSMYKYLRELQRQDLVYERVRDGIKHYYLKKFKIVITPERLSQFISPKIDYIKVFSETYGVRRLDEIKSIAKKASEGKMTLRQAASEAGLSYHEFMLIYDELGYTDE